MAILAHGCTSILGFMVTTFRYYYFYGCEVHVLDVSLVDVAADLILGHPISLCLATLSLQVQPSGMDKRLAQRDILFGMMCIFSHLPNLPLVEKILLLLL